MNAVCLAIPGQIVELLPGGHLATVEVSKVRRTINIDLLEDAPPGPGDWVLIHVGFAMSRISADHAAEQLRLLAMLGEDAQAMEELDGYRFGDELTPSPRGRPDDTADVKKEPV
jgi:hydrogenase expression/formation protein HypC